MNSESSRPETATSKVGDLMKVMGHTVRDTPTTEITDVERILRPRLVIGEAVEFTHALGCDLVATLADGTQVALDKTMLSIRINPERPVDLVEAVDSIADIDVVNRGSALTLGIDLDAAFDIVHVTNLAKLGPDGLPIYDAGNKFTKPLGWVPPTEALADMLVAHGWEGRDQWSQ